MRTLPATNDQTVLGMQVHVSHVLPILPDHKEDARRIVRHGMKRLSPWLDIEVGPKPGEGVHAIILNVMGRDEIYLSPKMHNDIRPEFVAGIPIVQDSPTIDRLFALYDEHLRSEPRLSEETFPPRLVAPKMTRYGQTRAFTRDSLGMLESVRKEAIAKMVEKAALNGDVLIPDLVREEPLATTTWNEGVRAIQWVGMGVQSHATRLWVSAP